MVTVTSHQNWAMIRVMAQGSLLGRGTQLLALFDLKSENVENLMSCRVVKSTCGQEKIQPQRTFSTITVTQRGVMAVVAYAAAVAMIKEYPQLSGY